MVHYRCIYWKLLRNLAVQRSGDGHEAENNTLQPVMSAQERATTGLSYRQAANTAADDRD